MHVILKPPRLPVGKDKLTTKFPMSPMETECGRAETIVHLSTRDQDMSIASGSLQVIDSIETKR
jgi:hypothetical protein